MLDRTSPDAESPATPHLTLTPKLRADLRMLERFRPDGMTQANCGWSAHGRFLSKGRAAQLTALGYAWIDFSGWKPRIKIKLTAAALIDLAELGASVDLDRDAEDGIAGPLSDAFDDATAKVWERTREAAEDREAA